MDSNTVLAHLAVQIAELRSRIGHTEKERNDALGMVRHLEQANAEYAETLDKQNAQIVKLDKLLEQSVYQGARQMEELESLQEFKERMMRTAENNDSLVEDSVDEGRGFEAS